MCGRQQEATGLHQSTTITRYNRHGNPLMLLPKTVPSKNRDDGGDGGGGDDDGDGGFGPCGDSRGDGDDL